MNAVLQAIKNFGTQVAMADELGIEQSTVSEWARDVRPVPTLRCVQIERHVKNATAEVVVKRWDLRPKDWWLHWPELIGVDGAPSIPDPAGDGQHDQQAQAA